jgi:hypothetical protein
MPVRCYGSLFIKLFENPTQKPNNPRARANPSKLNRHPPEKTPLFAPSPPYQPPGKYPRELSILSVCCSMPTNFHHYTVGLHSTRRPVSQSPFIVCGHCLARGPIDMHHT